MAYLVIGVGVLMSLVGVYAIVSGFPVIEVERGWAELISGSTLLAGGLVTVALGLVLQTLLAIKHALPGSSFLTANADSAAVLAKDMYVSSPAEAPHVDTTTSATPTLAVLPATAFEDASGDHSHAFAVEHVEHQEALLPPADHAIEPHQTVTSIVPAEEQAWHEPAVAPIAHEPPLQEATFMEPALHDAETIAPIAAEVAPHPVHDSYELQSPSSPDHDLKPIQPAPSDDWLDRAFSELDEEILAGTRPVDRAPPALATLPAAPKLVSLEPPKAAYAEPAAKTIAAEPPPVLPPPTPSYAAAATVATDSPVIGRYESEGTSYVLFADGSIEAQSSAGIFRFRSMAELKAFIEG